MTYLKTTKKILKGDLAKFKEGGEFFYCAVLETPFCLGSAFRNPDVDVFVLCKDGHRKIRGWKLRFCNKGSDK